MILKGGTLADTLMLKPMKKLSLTSQISSKKTPTEFNITVELNFTHLTFKRKVLKMNRFYLRLNITRFAKES